MSLQREWRNTIAAFLFVGAGILIYFAFDHWAYDDPFITFRYAENFRAGLGFVYNPGERVLSTTTPLYALLLAGLSYLWRDLPRLSNLVSALSLALGGAFLYLIGRRWQEPLAGLSAAVLYPVFPLMIATFGAETCFYVMLILGAFAFYAGERYRAAMALAALATLTRPDGVLVAIVLGLDMLRRFRRVVWQPLLIFTFLVLPWYLFSWVYFGSPFPVTLAAKQHQGQMAISDSFAEGFLLMLKGYGRQPLYWLHGILAFLGVGYALFRGRKWLTLLLWGVLYFVAYVFLGVSRYHWYYAPLVPAILAAVGLGVATVTRRLRSILVKQHGIKVGVLAVVIALLLLPQVQGLRYVYHHPDTRVLVYREAGMWLAENTSPDANVGALEVGIIGYYAHRRMIDFAGLIQPDVARQMRQETTYQDTAIWAVQRYRPDYLVLNPQWFPALMDEFVLPFCSYRKSFTSANYPGELAIYECDWAR